MVRRGVVSIFGVVLLIGMLPTPVLAGHNAGGSARLSWASSGPAPNLTAMPADTMPLYLLLEGAPDVHALAVDCRWSPCDAGFGFAFAASQSNSGSCGSTVPGSPGGFAGDTSYSWTIAFPPGADRSCVKYSVVGNHHFPTPASFCLISVRTIDSDGSVDDLNVVGGATIRGGEGDGCPVVVESISPDIGAPGRLNVFTLEGRNFTPAMAVSFTYGDTAIAAASVEWQDEHSASAAVDIPSDWRGSVGVTIASSANADTMQEEITIPPSDAVTPMCGTPTPTPAVLASVQARLQTMQSTQSIGGTVHVAWHVITAGDAGALTDEQVQQQIVELNRACAGYYGGANTQFAFVLDGIDRVNNAEWFLMGIGSAAEVNAKKALAKDPAHTMNVYSCEPRNARGFSRFPWDYPETDILHGIAIDYRTLPGGSDEGHNLGRVFVHEVGHYLGLLHTFQPGAFGNACEPPGDEVEDTPYEPAVFEFPCTQRDNCAQPGPDPVHNMMTATDDDCRHEITFGQADRADGIVASYRPSLFTSGSLMGYGDPVTRSTAERNLASMLAATPVGSTSNTTSLGLWDRFRDHPMPDVRAGAAGTTNSGVLFLFGGDTGDSRKEFLNDVWCLDFGAVHTQPRWRLLATSGTSPSPRAYASAIWDDAGQRMIVFGGVDASGLRNDIWALGWFVGQGGQVGYAWQQLVPPGTELQPDPREWHSAVYDRRRGRMVVYGGSAGYGDDRGEVWGLDLVGAPHWTKMTTSGQTPPDREGHSAVVDTLGGRDRMIIYGGTSFGTPTVTAYALSLQSFTWSALFATNPPARSFHVAVLDTARQEMIIHGGQDAGGQTLADTWALSLAGSPTWTALPTAPLARSAACGIWDGAHGGLLACAGLRDASRVSDGTLLLRPASDVPRWRVFTTPDTAAPAARAGASLTYDPIGRQMLLFGGFAVQGGIGQFFNDTWAYDLLGTGFWAKLQPGGTVPNGRWGHSAVYDPGLGGQAPRLLVFCGEGGYNIDDRIFALSLGATPVWSQLPASPYAGPKDMVFAGAVADTARHRFLLFGGGGPCLQGSDPTCGFSSNTFELSHWASPTRLDWRLLTQQIPQGREGASVVLDDATGHMIVYGGTTADPNPSLPPYRLWDTWQIGWNDPSPQWVQRSLFSDPAILRDGQATAWDPSRGHMIVFGGIGPDTLQADAWMQEARGSASYWWEFQAASGPSPRLCAVAAWDPVASRTVTFGGRTNLGFSRETWGLTGSPDSALVDVPSTDVARVTSLQLLQSFPNPSSESAMLRFAVPVTGMTTLRLYDIQGRLVRTLASGILRGGPHDARWDGRDTAGNRVKAGVYLYRLDSPRGALSRKLIWAP